MKTHVRTFIALPVILVVAITCLIVWRNRPPPLPDEKKAAMELLVETQSGPRYFEAAGEAATPDEQGLVWIDPVDADSQIDSILKARHWNAGKRDQVRKLIAEASEPHPSRVVGGERINLAQLNLALDALP
jgi:hypothetical protein